MNLEELCRLNLRDAGSWPLLPKILILTAIVTSILVAGYFLDWRDQWDALEAAEAKPAS